LDGTRARSVTIKVHNSMSVAALALAILIT
jgi:hypothetical protein